MNKLQIIISLVVSLLFTKCFSSGYKPTAVNVYPSVSSQVNASLFKNKNLLPPLTSQSSGVKAGSTKSFIPVLPQDILDDLAQSVKGVPTASKAASNNTSGRPLSMSSSSSTSSSNVSSPASSRPSSVSLSRQNSVDLSTVATPRPTSVSLSSPALIPASIPRQTSAYVDLDGPGGSTTPITPAKVTANNQLGGSSAFKSTIVGSVLLPKNNSSAVDLDGPGGSTTSTNAATAKPANQTTQQAANNNRNSLTLSGPVATPAGSVPQRNSTSLDIGLLGVPIKTPVVSSPGRVSSIKLIPDIDDIPGNTNLLIPKAQVAPQPKGYVSGIFALLTGNVDVPSNEGITLSQSISQAKAQKPAHIIANYDKQFKQNKQDAFIQLNKDIQALSDDANYTAAEKADVIQNARAASDLLNKQVIDQKVKYLMTKAATKVTANQANFDDVQESYANDIDIINRELADNSPYKIVTNGSIQHLAAEQNQQAYIVASQLLEGAQLLGKGLGNSKTGSIQITKNRNSLGDDEYSLGDTTVTLPKKTATENLAITKLRVALDTVKDNTTLQKFLNASQQDLPPDFATVVTKQLDLTKATVQSEQAQSAARLQQAQTIANNLWNNYQTATSAARNDINFQDPVTAALTKLSEDLDTESSNDSVVRDEQKAAVNKIINDAKTKSFADIGRELNDLATQDIFKNSEVVKKYTLVIKNIDDKQEAAQRVTPFVDSLLQDSKSVGLTEIISRLEAITKAKAQSSTQFKNLMKEFASRTGMEIPDGMDLDILLTEVRNKQNNSSLAQFTTAARNVLTNLFQGNIRGTGVATAQTIVNLPGAMSDSTGQVSDSTRRFVIDFYNGDATKADNFLNSIKATLASVVIGALPIIFAINNNKNLSDDRKKSLIDELLTDIITDQTNVLTADLLGADVHSVASGNAQDIAESVLFNRIINSLDPSLQAGKNFQGSYTGAPKAVQSFEDKYKNILTPSTSSSTSPYSDYSDYSSQSTQQSYPNYAYNPSSTSTPYSLYVTPSTSQTTPAEYMPSSVTSYNSPATTQTSSPYISPYASLYTSVQQAKPAAPQTPTTYGSGGGTLSNSVSPSTSFGTTQIPSQSSIILKNDTPNEQTSQNSDISTATTEQAMVPYVAGDYKRAVNTPLVFGSTPQ